MNENLNPYHFLLLKELIKIEVKRYFNLKSEMTNEHLRSYIEQLKNQYGTRTGKQYAEYVIRRIWAKDIFSFKERQLDQLCELLITTRKFTSWKEFTIVHRNHFSAICEIYTCSPYFKLETNEIERIEHFVQTTCGIYKETQYLNQNALAELYDAEKILLSAVAKRPYRYDKAIVTAALNFINDNSKVIKNCLFGLLLVTMVYFGYSWLKILLAILLFHVVDTIILLILTRRNEEPGWMIYLNGLVHFMDALHVPLYKLFPNIYMKVEDNILNINQDENEDDLIIYRSRSCHVHFPLKVYIESVILRAHNINDFVFVKRMQCLGNDEAGKQYGFFETYNRDYLD